MIIIDNSLKSGDISLDTPFRYPPFFFSIFKILCVKLRWPLDNPALLNLKIRPTGTGTGSNGISPDIKIFFGSASIHRKCSFQEMDVAQYPLLIISIKKVCSFKIDDIFWSHKSVHTRKRQKIAPPFISKYLPKRGGNLLTFSGMSQLFIFLGCDGVLADG